MHDDTQPAVETPVERFRWEKALREAPVNGNYLCTLLMLATYMNGDGTCGRPGASTLSKACGLHERTVRRHLDQGVTDGYLVLRSRGHRRGDGVGMASEYHTSLPVPAARLSGFSSGPWDPEEDDLNRANGSSQPGDRSASTGRERPTTNPEDHEDQAGDWISEHHQSAAADGLRKLRETMGREA